VIPLAHDIPSSRAVDRLRLLGVAGSNRVMEGEARRLVRRAFERERAEELLNVHVQKLGTGAIAYPFSPDLAALLATYHRTGARLLWDLFELEETRLEPLYDTLRRNIEQDARDLFGGARARRITVLASGELPVEANPRQVVGTIKNALVDGAKEQGVELSVDAEHPDLTFWVRALETADGRWLTTLSLDVAGRPLHERGYRTVSGDAPIREDLAALLVMLARFDARTEALIDPMSGAGTLAIEAALMAQGRTIWTSGRSPQLANHGLFQADFANLGEPLFGDTQASIVAIELDPEVAEVQKRALMTAGLEHVITQKTADFRDVDPTELLDTLAQQGKTSGLILTNPPYGGRLEYTERELAELYRDLHDFWRMLPGFRIALFVGEPDRQGETPRIHLVERAFGARARVHKPLKNGPMRASFLLYQD
jgi:23S rRNA G2445 N2-methylase RlmL